jgi:predicted O-methyltransferase YrrM
MLHIYKSIQGWCSFTELYSEMVAKAEPGAIFVEIGCWKGKSAAFMAVEIINSGKAIKFFTVDHFKGSPNHGDNPDVAAGRLEAIARANLKPVARGVEIISASSVEAAAQFEDGTVDFLFIDGTHDYDNVKADLLAWKPKLKPGAMVAGDDANWRGVKEAAREVIGEIEVIEPCRKGRYWRAAA